MVWSGKIREGPYNEIIVAVKKLKGEREIILIYLNERGQ